MIFDVMLLLKEKNVAGKERRSVYRIHDRDLSRFLRDAQDRGDYIEQVHPLFRQRKQEEKDKYENAGLNWNEPYVDPVDPDGF
jgi:hypothetical protein